MISSNLAPVWSRGTFDPIVINGETIFNTVRDLGVYIDSSINLADHVLMLTTRTCFFKFVNLDLSIRCSLSNFRTPCAMVMTSLDYCNGLLGEKHAKCIISSLSGESEKASCRLGLIFLQKIALRFASLLTHAFVDLLHPIWYLTPVSDIPGRTFAHIRSAAVGMLNIQALVTGFDNRILRIFLSHPLLHGTSSRSIFVILDLAI